MINFLYCSNHQREGSCELWNQQTVYKRQREKGPVSHGKTERKILNLSGLEGCCNPSFWHYCSSLCAF